MSFKSWLQHAFAVDTKLDPPTAKELALVERLCKEVVRRELTLPAITVLESARPLNFIGSQAMQFFTPIVSAITQADEYVMMANFLERRDSTDILCSTLERLDKEAQQHRNKNATSSKQSES